MLERISELAHDDLVDLLFATGWIPLDQGELRVFFAQVHRIVVKRMRQLQQEQIEEMHRQVARLLECERGRLMARERKVFTS